MPNISERQSLLNEVDQALRMAILDRATRDDPSSDSEDFDDSSESVPGGTIETLMTLQHLISENKFLNKRRCLRKSRDYVLNYFLDQPDDSFRKITRVTRATFNYIKGLIEFGIHPVFHNVSTCDQAPVHWQLACALDRLGNDGQGVSHARSKLIWGIGQGTVHLYTRRVVEALFSLRAQFISWPNAEERAQTSRRLEAKGFKNVVGFVDGTCFPIHKKPSVYGNVFMDRKKRYSVNAQIVNDDKYRIIYFMTGHPSSCGDSRVFSAGIIARRTDMAFLAGEYLLADSANATTTTVVTPYKENQRDCPTDENEPRQIERFNSYLAKARVINEHTIGVLKSRWSCLRGMRIDIHKMEDMKSFVKQATPCIVLHNVCMEGDPWEDEYVDEQADDNLGIPIQERRAGRILSAGQRKRWEVRRACLAFHDRA